MTIICTYHGKLLHYFPFNTLAPTVCTHFLSDKKPFTCIYISYSVSLGCGGVLLEIYNRKSSLNSASTFQINNPKLNFRGQSMFFCVFFVCFRKSCEYTHKLTLIHSPSTVILRSYRKLRFYTKDAYKVC